MNYGLAVVTLALSFCLARAPPRGAVHIAAWHADPRTTMRSRSGIKNLDRHPNYILAAYMASGT